MPKKQLGEIHKTETSVDVLSAVHGEDLRCLIEVDRCLISRDERPAEISVSGEREFVVGADRTSLIIALGIAVDEQLKARPDTGPVIVFSFKYRPISITVGIERIFLPEFGWMQIDIGGPVPSGFESESVGTKAHVARLLNPDSKAVKCRRVRYLVDALPWRVRSFVEIDTCERLVFVVVFKTN